jgi:uncharacterized membrane protein YccC
MYQLGQTGGASGDVLMLAIDRASEICVGIVSAGVVLAGTDFGGARRELFGKIAKLTAAVANGLTATLGMPKSQFLEAQLVRRQLVRDVAALSPAIDQAIGESSELRARSRVLQDAVSGLFTVIASWRIVAEHLREVADEACARIAAAVLRVIPDHFRSGHLGAEAATRWAADPLELRQSARETAFALMRLPAQDPSERLVTDRAAQAMLGLAHAFNGLLFIDDPRLADVQPRIARLHVPDWLPPSINAGRIFVTMGLAQLFWIITAWPNGASAVTFAAVIVILFSPRDEQAYPLALDFFYGMILVAIVAAVIDFVVLPKMETFLGFSLALGLALVPLGALSAQPWKAAMFSVMAFNLSPLIGIRNVMVYDASQFFNSAIGIIIGTGFAALIIRLIPPLSQAQRSRRLLALTLRDLQRLAERARAVPPRDWQDRIFARLAVLPQTAELHQGAQLVAALSLGNEIIRLRRVADRLGIRKELEPALYAIADGESRVAVQWLAQADQVLATPPEQDPDPNARLLARARLCAMTEALTLFADYFDGKET